MNQIAVLASGGGSTFENLVRTQHRHGGKIVLLVSDRPCLAAKKCKDFDIDYFESKDSEEIFEKCRAYNIALVCCAGWLRKLSIPHDFENKVMNIHPSLLPAFGGKGMYGMHVHEAVFGAGCRVSGCTVHFVNDDYDAGPIILQYATSIEFAPAPEWIQGAVKLEEDRAYPRAVKLFLNNILEVRGNRVLRKTDCDLDFYDS